jgi:hypothetical protein
MSDVRPGVLDAIPSISLRDWFAGLAMQALISRDGQQYGSASLVDIAETAREAADSLIEELHPPELHDTEPAPAPTEATSTEVKRGHDIDNIVDAALAAGMVTESIPAPASEPIAGSDESPVDVAQPARGPLRRCENPGCGCHTRKAFLNE